MTRSNFIRGAIAAAFGFVAVPAIAKTVYKVSFDDVKNELYDSISAIMKANTYEHNTKELRRKIEAEVLDCIYAFMKKYDLNLIENKVICDETNNTELRIDNNELHLTVALKVDNMTDFKVIKWMVGQHSMPFAFEDVVGTNKGTI